MRLLPGLFVLALLGVASVATAEGPLAIHAPSVVVPEATAGSGLAPEAAVKISIDERGAVTKVDVVSIAPSSEYDELFRKELVDKISQWRFAPAVEGGKAVASTLDWRVRFPSRPAPLPTAVDVTAPLVGSDAEQRRSVVMALSPEQRRKLLVAQTATAMGFLDPQRTSEASSPRFAVHADADDRNVAATVAGNLEAIFNALAQELLPGMSLQPEPFKVQVVVFRDRASFESLIGELPAYEWSTGSSYSPAGLITFHLQQTSNEAVMTLLLHEATHAFLDRHVVRPGVALPRWLSEGFADYVANSRIEGGRLQPGKTQWRAFEMHTGGVRRVQTQAGAQLDEAKRALRQGHGVGVRDLLEPSPQIFYGAKGALFYASSWLLVHYLRDGEAGWARDRFPQLVLYLAEGYPQTAAFRSVYGAAESADADFRKYVKTF